ncbi:MAG: hypothetical protein HVN35_10950 [Methanobacteriaceae archaeon]|nr:hypothetical protein [Methanobacteriaceae archaeon]
MNLVNYKLLIFLFIGFIAFPSGVFALVNVHETSGSYLDANTPPVTANVFLPVLKVGRGIDLEDIQEFMALPLEDKIFSILFVVAILAFVIWYTLMGKKMALFLRIPIIIGLSLLILVPTYLSGNMIWFMVAAITITVVLIVTWYQEHGRFMNTTRLIGTLLGALLLLGLLVGLPAYYYFTASEEMSNIEVSSKNPSLQIIDYKAYRLSFSGSTVEFGGYVKNNGNTPVSFVKINATGYDTNGNIVSNKTTFVDDDRIFPGSSSKFGYLSKKFSGSLEDPERRIVKVKLEVIDYI